MILYITIVLQAAIIGAFIYKRRQDKIETELYVQESGEMGAQYVDLIHTHERMKKAAKILVTVYEDSLERLKELQDNYTTVENSSVAQTELIEEQYDMIQAYDTKLTSLQEKIDNFQRLRIN